MQSLLEILKSDMFVIIMSCTTIVLLIAFFVLLIKLSSINKKYKKFMKKLGKGTDIQQDLMNYMDEVEKVKQQNQDIITYLKAMDKNISKCIQKVGMVRYSAFKDTGSDLSFALALLDENDSGVVLNGIYSREMSNIYAKPVEKGRSTYAISEEEKEAIKRAVSSS